MTSCVQNTENENLYWEISQSILHGANPNAANADHVFVHLFQKILHSNQFWEGASKSENAYQTLNQMFSRYSKFTSCDCLSKLIRKKHIGKNVVHYAIESNISLEILQLLEFSSLCVQENCDQSRSIFFEDSDNETS